MLIDQFLLVWNQSTENFRDCFDENKKINKIFKNVILNTFHVLKEDRGNFLTFLQVLSSRQILLLMKKKNLEV